MSANDWQTFDLLEEIERLRSSGSPYNEFLRVPTLSSGIYMLKAGSKDLQSPHDEDEVYVVIQGRARLKIEDRDVAVGPGSILYIEASSEHSFFEIEEDLTLLVFFATGGSAPRS
jgi:mannose-6-phosphate isomerase-like protein (cupin superfamily)